MSHIRNRQLDADQRGMASILVSMIMIIVITLLVLGFAQIADREQRNSLDNQLATQAYYAAESGINDVVSYLASNPGTTTNKTVCGDSGTAPWHAFYQQYQQVLGSNTQSNDVTNSCILVNNAPGTLTKQFSTTGQSWVVPLNASTYGAITSINFTLTSSGTGNPTACNTAFSQGSLPPVNSATVSACDYPALRFDLVPIGVASATTPNPATMPNTLFDNTMSRLAVPQSSGGTMNFLANSTNTTASDVYAMSCTEQNCTLSINTTTNPIAGANQFYLRIMALYSTGTLNISGTYANGSSINWSGAQVLVDSTAKAQDEIKRLQATVPVNSSGQVPDFGIQTTGPLCKYFSIMPNSAPDDTLDPNCSLN